MSRLQLFLCGIDKKEETRLKEYVNDLKKPTNSLSIISCRKLDNDHTIDWDDTIILDSEHSYYKRMISEMTYQLDKGLNKQSDTERFPEIYLSLIGKSSSTHT